MSQTNPHEVAAAITLPGNWLTVDLESFGDEGAVNRLVTERLSVIPELSGHEGELADLISRSASLGENEGVSFAAVLAEVDDANAPTVANLALAVAENDAPESGLRDKLGVQNGVDEPGVREHAVDDIELTAGPAVRIARLHNLPLGDTGIELAVLTVQYWLFVPGEEQIGVLNFATPSLARHRELAREFHAIANSLRFESAAAD